MSVRAIPLFLFCTFAATAVACGGREDGAGESEDGGVTDWNPDSSGEKFDLGGGGDTVNQDSGGGCGDVNVMVEPETPTIVLLVDQSGSMTQDFMGTNRWEALYTTLMDPATGVIGPLEDRMRFGLTLYTSEDGFEGGTCPMLSTVEPALLNRGAMDAVFEPADPVDETPTGESLEAVAEELDKFPEPGPKAIVLATDGQPDTCDRPNPQEGEPESIAAAEAAFALGIKTFILSVGPDVAQDHLQEMANVGIGRAIDSAMPAPYWQALDAGELEDAFNQIIGSFVSCTFTLNGIVDLDDFCEGSVWIDGRELACPDEWQLLGDGRTIELLGAACEGLKDGQSHSIQADFPCGSFSPTP